jgi:hypothetical protein
MLVLVEMQYIVKKIGNVFVKNPIMVLKVQEIYLRQVILLNFINHGKKKSILLFFVEVQQVVVQRLIQINVFILLNFQINGNKIYDTMVKIMMFLFSMQKSLLGI